jgi:hypothetical protein
MFTQIPIFVCKLNLLPLNVAWLLVFRAGILTADFIRVSVTLVDMMQMRPTVA